MTIVNDAPVGDAAEENVEMVESVVDENEDYSFEKIMKMENGEKTGLRGELRSLQY